MTRVLVPKGSGSGNSSSSNQSRSSPATSVSREDQEKEVNQESSSVNVNESVEQAEVLNSENASPETAQNIGTNAASSNMTEQTVTSQVVETEVKEEDCDSKNPEFANPPPPPPPPVPPVPGLSSPRRTVLESGNAGGSSRRQWPSVLSRTSPTGSRSSSPRPLNEGEGYNSSDEQGPCYWSPYDDLERERMFEINIRRTMGLEVRKMLGDGNCMFRAIADQVYGDPEMYDVVRQACIDYMERERDHFSQFVTENFTSYCRRKRRDKVYGNNVELQAFCELYNRPILVYSYGTEPINTFQGTYATDTPPIRLSFHQSNHYNSLVDPRRMNIGAGLGYSSLRGTNIDKDQVKAAIKAQQDQQIDNALLAEGRFYSDLELTEKEIERQVMEASRLEYQLGFTQSSTSTAQPSSSGGSKSTKASSPKKGESEKEVQGGSEKETQSPGLRSSVQAVLAMGFDYLQAIEAHALFGDDVDSMVNFLLSEISGASSPSTSQRSKGKATK